MADENPVIEEELNESSVVNLDEEEAKPAAAKPPPVPGPSTTPQTGLQELQQQINAERQERARVNELNRQLQSERDQALAFAQEAERKGVSTYELYNENQIKAAQDQMEALALQAEQAMQDGDFKRATTINLKIGRLGGALAVLERDQAVLQQQREAAEQQARQQPRQPARQEQPQQPQLPTDPLERAMVGRSEPAKAFIRKHPEVIRGDGTLKRNVIDAHERALDEGHRIDSQAYFEYIEKSLAAQAPGNGPVPRGAPTMAAPVGRDATPGSPARGGEFTMTPKMRRLAAEQGVSEKEWAQNYVRLLNEGRITPIT